MKPAKYDLEINQGSTFIRAFTLVDEAFNFDDYTTFKLQIRKNPSSSTVLFDTSVNSGSLVKTSATVLTLTISAALTAGFAFTSASYDLEMIKDLSTDIVDKMVYGNVTVKLEITK